MSSPNRKTTQSRMKVGDFLFKLSEQLDTRYRGSSKSKTKAGIVSKKLLQDYTNDEKNKKIVSKIETKINEYESSQEYIKYIIKEIENGNRNVLKENGLKLDKFFDLRLFPEQQEQEEEKDEEEKDEEQQPEEPITPAKKKKDKKVKKDKKPKKKKKSEKEQEEKKESSSEDEKEKPPEPIPTKIVQPERERSDLSQSRRTSEPQPEPELTQAQEARKALGLKLDQEPLTFLGVKLTKEEWAGLVAINNKIEQTVNRSELSNLRRLLASRVSTIAQSQDVTTGNVIDAVKAYTESLEEDQKVQQKYIPEKFVKGRVTTAGGITVQEAEKTRTLMERQAKASQEREEELRKQLADERAQASKEMEELREQLRKAEGKAILERTTIMEEATKNKEDILKESKKQTDKLSKQLKESKGKQARLLSLIVTSNKKIKEAEKQQTANRKEIIQVANQNKKELLKKLELERKTQEALKKQIQDTETRAQEERKTFALKAQETASQFAKQAEDSRIQIERQATEQRAMIAKETMRRFNILDKDIKKRLIEKETKKIKDKKTNGISKENVDVLINTMPADEKRLYGQSVRDLLSGNINANSMASGIVGFLAVSATGNPLAASAIQSGFNFIRNVVGFDFNSVFSDSNIQQEREKIEKERKDKDIDKTIEASKNFEQKLNALIKKQEKEQEITRKQITTKAKQDEKEFKKQIDQQQKEQKKLLDKTVKQSEQITEQKSRIAKLLQKPELKESSQEFSAIKPITELKESKQERSEKLQKLKKKSKEVKQLESRIAKLLQKPELKESTQELSARLARLPITELKESSQELSARLARLPITELKESSQERSARLARPLPATLETMSLQPITVLMESSQERSGIQDKLLSRYNNIEDMSSGSDNKHSPKDLKTVTKALSKVIEDGEDPSAEVELATSDVVEELSPSLVSRMAAAIRNIPSSIASSAENLRQIMSSAVISASSGSADIILSPIDRVFVGRFFSDYIDNDKLLNIPDTASMSPIPDELKDRLAEAAIQAGETKREEKERKRQEEEENMLSKIASQRREREEIERLLAEEEKEGLLMEKEMDSDFVELREILANTFGDELQINTIEQYIRTLTPNDRKAYLDFVEANEDGQYVLPIDSRPAIYQDIKKVEQNIGNVLRRTVQELRNSIQQSDTQRAIDQLTESKIFETAINYVQGMTATVLETLSNIPANAPNFGSVASSVYRALPTVVVGGLARQSDIADLARVGVEELRRQVPPLIAPTRADVRDAVVPAVAGGVYGAGMATGSAMGAVGGAIPGAIAGAGAGAMSASAVREYYRQRGVDVDSEDFKKKLSYYSMIPAVAVGAGVGYAGIGSGMSGAGITEKKILVDADVLAETQAKEEQDIGKNKHWAPKQIAPSPAILDEPAQEKYAEDLETTLFDYVVPTSEGADGTIMTNQLKKNQYMNEQLRYTDAGVYIPKELWGQILNDNPATIKNLALGSKPLISTIDMEFIPADNETTFMNVAKLQYVNKENTSVGLFDPYGNFSDVTNYWTITPDSVLYTENP